MSKSNDGKDFEDYVREELLEGNLLPNIEGELYVQPTLESGERPDFVVVEEDGSVHIADAKDKDVLRYEDVSQVIGYANKTDADSVTIFAPRDIEISEGVWEYADENGVEVVFMEDWNDDHLYGDDED